MAADTKRGAVFDVEVRNSRGRLYATVTLDAIQTALAAQGLYVGVAPQFLDTSTNLSHTQPEQRALRGKKGTS